MYNMVTWKGDSGCPLVAAGSGKLIGMHVSLRGPRFSHVTYAQARCFEPPWHMFCIPPPVVHPSTRTATPAHPHRHFQVASVNEYTKLEDYGEASSGKKRQTSVASMTPSIDSAFCSAGMSEGEALLVRAFPKARLGLWHHCSPPQLCPAGPLTP